MDDQGTQSGAEARRIGTGRPLLGGEALVIALAVIRRNPATTLGLAALLSTVTGAVNSVAIDGVLIGGNPGSPLARLISGAGLTSADLPALGAAISAGTWPLVAMAATAIIVQIAASGVLTMVTFGALENEHVTPAAAWRRVGWPRLIMTSLLVALCISLAGVVSLPLLLLSGDFGALAGLGLGIVGAAAMMVFTALAVPVTLIEGRGPWRSIRRSIDLVRGAFWRTAWLVVLANVFGQAAATLVSFPVSVMSGIGGGVAAKTFGSIVAAIAGGAVSLPIVAAMTTVIYLDRQRRSAPAQ